MKSILQSLSKDECFRIANGQQTITRVKRAPKTETPFKVYVYMKMGNVPKTITTKDGKTMSIYEFEPMLLSGRVIMEYICDSVDGNTLHISDLKIYDKPKELREFRKPCVDEYQYCQSCKYGLVTLSPDEEEYAMYHGGSYEDFDTVCLNRVTRPPQSWQYVEELSDD